MLYKASLVAQLGKESASSAGDLGSISGLGRSPGAGNSNSLQYSCLENSMEEPGRLQSMGCKEWDMTEATQQEQQQQSFNDSVLVLFLGYKSN